jgi:hypothetical protein
VRESLNGEVIERLKALRTAHISAAVTGKVHVREEASGCFG